MNIPEGYGLIAGRTQQNAIDALAATEKAGLDPTLVQTVAEGYLVPEAALDHLEQDALEEAPTVPPAESTADTLDFVETEGLGESPDDLAVPDPGVAETTHDLDLTPEPEAPAELEEPPVSGAGSSTKAWEAYAKTKGYDESEEKLDRAALIERYATPKTED